jgi:hypothetical protein
MIQNNQIHKQPTERARAVVNCGMIAEQFDIGADFYGSDEMTSESEIDMNVSKTGGKSMKEAVFGRSDQERFIIYLEISQRNVEHWAAVVASSSKLGDRGNSHVSSGQVIAKIMFWEEFDWKSFVRSNGETFGEGGMYELDRAFDSFLFFVEKIYPGKVRMLKQYLEEIHHLWSDLGSAMSWKGFLLMDEHIRAE